MAKPRTPAKRPVKRTKSRAEAESGQGLATFRERVWAVVRSIPRGRVASYGGVAAVMGMPRAARAVGTALCALADDNDVPWWRVVNRNGEISIKCSVHGPQLQRALLKREGVRFTKDRIDWSRFGWDGTGVPVGIRTDGAMEDAEWTAKKAARRASRRRVPSH